MEKFQYLQHPVRCTITGSSECDESHSVTKLIVSVITEYDKIYMYSPHLLQDYIKNQLYDSVKLYQFT